MASVVKSPWGVECGFGLNKNVLTIDGKPVRGRAATVHSGTMIRYFIPKTNFQLKVSAAIPDYIAGKGGATVRIVIKSGSKVLASSEVIKQGAPGSLAVNLAGLQEFSISIDAGGDGEFCDNVVITEINLTPQ